MSRHLAAAASTPAMLWGEIEAGLRSVARLFRASPDTVSGLEALEREHARIRLTSRHWLVG